MQSLKKICLMCNDGKTIRGAKPSLALAITELIPGTQYIVQNGTVSVTVNGHYGAILAQ